MEQQALKTVIESFYSKVFTDVMIGYLFADTDFNHIVTQQLHFTSGMLGLEAPPYRGRSLKVAHNPLKLRKAHFNRRHVILAEVLGHSQMPKDLAQKWLTQERALMRQVLG